ncbi:unnamed protein product [Protopolystoma xenopodis]|uniref:Uncharacterized protein n=1 Tax=Protopolystoma xenopodis TaxID=117903 RepID=A0A448WFP3_9PLAT|nr:unnamed protein product [Protopolystoma xenopodis]
MDGFRWLPAFHRSSFPGGCCSHSSVLSCHYLHRVSRVCCSIYRGDAWRPSTCKKSSKQIYSRREVGLSPPL